MSFLVTRKTHMIAYLMSQEELNQSVTTRELTGKNANKVELIHKTCEYIKDHNIPVVCIISLANDPKMPKNCPSLNTLFPDLQEKQATGGP
jgi:hypothetical protein